MNYASTTLVGFSEGDFYFGGRNYGDVTTNEDNSSVVEVNESYGAQVTYGASVSNKYSESRSGELTESQFSVSRSFIEYREISYEGRSYTDLTNPPSPDIQQLSLNLNVSTGVILMPEAGIRILLYSDTLRKR